MASDAVARARALIGTRFRLHGRLHGRCVPKVTDAGLDCIGLVAAALDARAVPTGYRLRHGSDASLAAGFAAAGLRRVTDGAPGDVVAFAVGPGQRHVGLWTGTGIVHACASAGRVIETAMPIDGPPGWVRVGSWRQEQG